jgi:hypothetical protein
MSWFKQNAPPQQPQGQLGSLGSLGGGQQPPMTGIDWDQHLVGSRPGEPGFDPNKGFNQILYPGGQLPLGWQPNTGGMNPNQPDAGGMGIPPPVGIAPTGGTGSLQSLGGTGIPGMVQRGAQAITQSGMVNLRGPDGSTKAVPQSDLAHWLSRGAQQIQGAF